MANFGKMNFSVALNPTSGFPLDARSYFESLAAAQAAAAQAREAGNTESVYYYGQHLAVVENGVASMYIIQPDNTLKPVGSGGTTDHSALTNRDAPDQHPMEAITGLKTKLDGTLEGEVITNSEVAEIWNNIMTSS